VTDRQTDGQTERQNYNSQDRTSIAASRGKKPFTPVYFRVISANSSAVDN